MKTAWTTAVLTAALLLVLGASRADELRKTDEARISDEIARHLAERLSGREPGSAGVVFLGEQMPVRRGWTIRVPLTGSPVKPCLAQAGSAESDPCAVARDLSHQGPCLGPQNCPALDTWRQLYGWNEPRVVPAEPAPPSLPALASAKEEE